MELIGKLGTVLDDDDVRLLTEAVQTAIRLESGEGFSAKAVVAMRDGSPRIDCTWMGMLAQITPEQARSIALGLMEEAAEAETDAALLKFFQGTGISLHQVGEAICKVREIRSHNRSPVVGEKQEPSDSLRKVAPMGSKPM